jgi:hypothetical protein
VHLPLYFVDYTFLFLNLLYIKVTYTSAENKEKSLQFHSNFFLYIFKLLSIRDRAGEVILREVEILEIRAFVEGSWELIRGYTVV